MAFDPRIAMTNRTTMIKPLGRRTLLRGAGGVALGLPFLEAMRPRSAQAQPAIPKRVMFVFLPNGNQHSTRFAQTGETTFKLGEFLSPLEPQRNEILLLNGIDKKHAKIPANQLSDAHQQAGAGLAPWPSGSGSFPIGGTDRFVGYVEGPSADFELGNRVLAANPSVPQRHLVFRVGQGGNNIWSVCSHGGPVGKQNPISPETDPYAAYARLFGAVKFDSSGKPDPAILRRLAKKQSALDLVLVEANTLRAKVGAGDRAKVDQHLQSLHDIERTLKGSQVPTLSAACQPLMLGAKIDLSKDENHAVVGDLFSKISAMAFACDLTRVVNFAWSGNTGGRVYRNLGISEGHHDISHISDDAAFAKIRKINQHLWGLNVNLHNNLKAIKEGDGSVWDNTLVVHWNELGQGDLHSTDNDLVVLSGGASKQFKMGRMLEIAKKYSFSDVIANVFQYMGFPDVKTFGDPRLSTGGPIPGLMV